VYVATIPLPIHSNAFDPTPGGIAGVDSYWKPVTIDSGRVVWVVKDSWCYYYYHYYGNCCDEWGIPSPRMHIVRVPWPRKGNRDNAPLYKEVGTM
jgi:hypothetical protein